MSWYPQYKDLSEEDRQKLLNLTFDNLTVYVGHAEPDDGGISFNIEINGIQLSLWCIDLIYFAEIVQADKSKENFEVLKEVLEVEKELWGESL
jgi:hypothetical protein